MTFGYNPAHFPDPESDPKAFNQRIIDEFQQIQKSLSGSVTKMLLSELHVEPDKKQVGMLVLADGSDWNPGSGGGVYCWDVIPPAVDPAWQFLGVAAGAIPSTRSILSADRTYYVDASLGSDSNDGLAAGSGHAFATVTKAVAAAQALDWAGYSVTIQIADGTYNETVTIAGGFVGTDDTAGLIIKGNSGTPANVKIGQTGASAYGIIVYGGARVTIKDCQPRCGSGGACIRVLEHGVVYYTNLDFGANSGGYHIQSSAKGFIRATGNYKISGGVAGHWLAQNGGIIVCDTLTLTITGSPTITTFASASYGGFVYAPGNTYSGAVTAGTKYALTAGGLLYRNGSTLPGATAGTCDFAFDDGTFKISTKTVLYAGISADLTGGGFTSTSFDNGTKSSGTFTPAYSNGNVQHATFNGALTLAPPSGDGSMVLDITNGASAGAITTSGFTKVSGDALDTTSGHKWRLFISTGNAGSHLFKQAMF